MLKKYFLTNIQGFDLHLTGVYCKPCLQPISCYHQFPCYLVSSIVNDGVENENKRGGTESQI